MENMENRWIIGWAALFLSGNTTLLEKEKTTHAVRDTVMERV